MYALALTATLTGVTNLRPNDTAESPFWYTFKIQCTSCFEKHENFIAMDRFDRHSLHGRRLLKTENATGSRGTANFVWRCKNCKRESSATIRAAPKSYEMSDPPKQQDIIEVDCRGLELVDFKPDGEWLAEGAETGTKFDAIELSSDGEWYDYDEKAKTDVSIVELNWEIRRA